jgi:hypothetical protein
MGEDLALDEVRGSSPIMSTKDVILEMRADLKRAGADLHELKLSHAILLAGQPAMLAVQADIENRLHDHDVALSDLKLWQNEVTGALKLTRWALGASLLAALLLIFDMVERLRPGI